MGISGRLTAPVHSFLFLGFLFSSDAGAIAVETAVSEWNISPSSPQLQASQPPAPRPPDPRWRAKPRVQTHPAGELSTAFAQSKTLIPAHNGPAIFSNFFDACKCCSPVQPPYFRSDFVSIRKFCWDRHSAAVTGAHRAVGFPYSGPDGSPHAFSEVAFPPQTHGQHSGDLFVC